jgi:hypothetical protein
LHEHHPIEIRFCYSLSPPPSYTTTSTLRPLCGLVSSACFSLQLPVYYLCFCTLWLPPICCPPFLFVSLLDTTILAFPLRLCLMTRFEMGQRGPSSALKAHSFRRHTLMETNMPSFAKIPVLFPAGLSFASVLRPGVCFFWVV